jgi:signal transduction histidine kinase
VKAKENLKHAQWLIKRFREYPDMIEEGKKVHLVEKVKDALEYVKELREFTYGDLNDFDISIEGDSNTSLVIGSGDLIEETFVNIFDNAFKTMNAGEKKLRISIRDTEENMVEVKVTDTGHGISEENKKRIFEPFFTTREGKGTGLGLYFAKMIVDNHGGEITFESEEGKGTTFTVSLPIASDEAGAAPSK